MILVSLLMTMGVLVPPGAVTCTRLPRRAVMMPSIAGPAVAPAMSKGCGLTAVTGDVVLGRVLRLCRQTDRSDYGKSGNGKEKTRISGHEAHGLFLLVRPPTRAGAARLKPHVNPAGGSAPCSGQPFSRMNETGIGDRRDAGSSGSRDEPPGCSVHGRAQRRKASLKLRHSKARIAALMIAPQTQ